jgi:hypothetical protein
MTLGPWWETGGHPENCKPELPELDITRLDDSELRVLALYWRWDLQDAPPSHVEHDRVIARYTTVHAEMLKRGLVDDDDQP